MADPIAAFWTWWKTGRTAVERALARKDISAIQDELTARVTAIDPELKWELGPEGDGTHGFALCWEGDLVRRRLVERWRTSAPKRATWQFFAGRPAGAWKPMVLEFGKHSVAFDEFVAAFEVDDTRERVDLELFHPATAKATQNARATAGLLLLDRAFGEDGVERWIGTIDFATARPRGARPFADVVKAVGKLARKATGERWNLYSGERDGALIVIACNEALKAIDHLACDHELAIAAAYEVDRGGLPTAAELEALEQLEELLVEQLGASAAYHGRETSAGTRTLYWFAPRELATDVAAWRKRHKRRIAITWTDDPTWERLDRWR